MKYILLSFLLFITTLGFGQNIFTGLGSNEKRADRLYEQLAFAPAAELYQQALSRSRNNEDGLKLKLARCYYRMNELAQSAYWFGQVTTPDSVLTADDQLAYAQSLGATEGYAAARQQYEAIPQEDLAEEKIAGFNALGQFYEDSAYYEVKPLSVNTELTEYGAAYYKDGIVYAACEQGQGITERTFRWNNTPFLDLYYVPVDTSGNTGTPRPFDRGINTKFHEGSATFFNDGQRMIFTRNSYVDGEVQESDAGINKLKLFIADREDDGDGWTNVQPLPFNNDEYATGQPAMSADGQTLYFTSDAPGGSGGTDLYACEYQQGQWGTPRNLGQPINTAGDEMFPFVHSDGSLYFASRGHQGLGGLDIFRVATPDDEPQNLGYPVNSSLDDFALVLDSAGRHGFFSSNREGGGADDNLYAVVISKPAVLLVQGRVTDEETGEPLSDVTVTIRDSTGAVVKDTTTDDEGRYEFEVAPDSEYTVRAEEGDNYEEQLERISAAQARAGTYTVENRLRKRPDYIVQGQVTDQATGNALPGATVTLIDPKTDQTIARATADKDGRYQLNVDPDQQYEIRARQKNYFSGKESVQVTREGGATTTKDLTLLSSENLNPDNIYYDFDASAIRPTAARELDQLVEIMNNNPTLNIELSSHTDARGDNPYNQALSLRRAEAAVEYIKQRGIAADRITARGYGETRLVNDCTDGVSCTEAQHQANRRTAFTVVQ
ncbi:MAG: carboxypeptidase regulatory-like domain-containing protein [Tunicatimonas sp.]